MSGTNSLSRRRFVHIAGLGAASVCVLTQCTRQISGWRFFTEAEAILMDSLAEQIIPTDEWPGGRDSGVSNYIDKQLTGPYVRFQVQYRKGLEAIQLSCIAKHQKKFEELPWNTQTSLLEAMEGGKLTGSNWEGESQSKFFGLFSDHCMQAYYGSPRHGGNRNNMSYKMLQLDYPIIIGQNRYTL
jgi:gluconate 2-dehydrogenase gamma chain